MPISTFQNDTGTAFIFTLQGPDRFGVIRPFNLTGFTNANFTLHLYQASPPTTIICAGNWTVIDGPSGVVMYQPLSSEVATAGAYVIYLAVVFPNGPKTMQPDNLTIVAVH